MKVERSGEGYEFFLRKREKDLLLYILKLYPRTPPGHQRLTGTKSAAELEGTRRLLDEALEAGRKETRDKLEEWLAASTRFLAFGKGYKLQISADEIEWLLQVLNEIRVGSWIRLGSPAQEINMAQIKPENAADFGVMSMAGLFEMHLLEAVGGLG